MWFRTLINSLARPKRRRAARLNPPSCRLFVEGLEDRRLLTFLPAVSYPADASPLAMVTGDFNGDGQLDLATANPGSHSVSVLLGDGAGGFGAAFDSTGTTNDAFERVSVAIADFNNDGDLDLATAMYGYYEYSIFGRLDVWMGNGDGTFQSPTLVRGGAPLAVAAGDFNNDGNGDLVFTDFDGQQGFVQVLPGNGLGGFTTSGWGLGSNYAPALSVGDLNGDGDLDAVAVAGEFGSDGAAFLGNGAGRLFTADVFFSTTYLPARAVAVGDFTGDGIPDLVVSGGAVEIFTGVGDGTFDEPIVHSANGYEHTGVAVADFNGDGLLDAVTSDRYEGTVSVLPGNGNGTLTYAGAYAVGLSPSAIAVGDFNGDGRTDVATADAGSNTVSVLLNDGDWATLPPIPSTLSISDTTVTEGDSGTLNANFAVSLSHPSAVDITVQYSTMNMTATQLTDYTFTSGTLTIPAGQTSRTFTVPIKGDRIAEPTETFSVNLSNAAGVPIADAQGIGTIIDNEPWVSINDVSTAEGNSKTPKTFTFTVSLSAAYDQAVTVNYATANGTAKASSDYQSKTGSVMFAPGETSKTITVAVIGDNQKEANETFFMNLSAATGAGITDSQGLGTILNDDGSSGGSGKWKQAVASAFAVDAAIEDWMRAGRKRNAR